MSFLYVYVFIKVLFDSMAQIRLDSEPYSNANVNVLNTRQGELHELKH
jgi:hypothetical protein